MANLNNAEKWRVITTLLNNDNIDDATTLLAAKAGAPKSLRWAEPFYAVYGGPQLYEEDGVTPRLPTNAEYFKFARQILRRRVREIRQESVGPAAATAAQATANSGVVTDYTTDFGADE